MFQHLAASRPERGAAGAVAASVASVGLHGMGLLLVAWGTVVAAWAQAGRVPALSEKYEVVDVVPPDPDAGGGQAAPASAQRAGPSTDEVTAEARRLLKLEPPVIEPVDIPPPIFGVLASLRSSEYGGLGEGDPSAAAIVDARHEASADELETSAPQFTSYTEAPELTNSDEVRKELTREYPGYLQDNGIGGRVLLWFLIDEQGTPRRWLIKQSSGHSALDRVALRVASLMRFRPAVNYDHHVAVWVALPVLFRLADS
jgi:TonB family protein